MFIIDEMESYYFIELLDRLNFIFLGLQLLKWILKLVIRHSKKCLLKRLIWLLLRGCFPPIQKICRLMTQTALNIKFMASVKRSPYT
jgi:hypothetical protein